MWVDGEDRSPNGRIRRAILGLLALEAGRDLDIDTLIDRVWNGSPPSTARASLQGHITHIRRRLSVDDTLITYGGGYRLEVDEGHVDALRFSAAVRHGRTHLDGGRFEPAEIALADALGEWSEPPLPDLADLDAAHPHITELTALHQEAEIGLATARLQLRGRSPDIAQLEALVERYPLDERSWQLLMRGLYRMGRQADALTAFQRASRILAEQLGLEPGPDLRELEGQILEGDPALEPPVPAQVDLPAFTTPFFGREEMVQQISKEIPEQRLITLVGMGGVGKTRLVVEAARRAAADFSDGAAFVTLESVDDPRLVPRVIIEVTQRGDAPAVDSAATLIGDRNLLVVIDNCEHLIDSVATEITGLLQSCPNLAIAATSRVPLGVKGETVWTVDPFELPGQEDTVAELHGRESVMFFTEAARRVSRNFDLTSANAAGVSGLCRDLAGIPLALELAAASCDVLTPGDIQERLTRAGATARAELGRPGRHHSIDEMVTWSLGLLDPIDRNLFEKMAVFAGPVDRDAIAAVCIGEDDYDTDETLRRLAHSSLITVNTDGNRATYHQLPPLKQAASRRLSATGRDELRRRHTSHFLARATSTGGDAGTSKERAWFDEVESVIDEVRLALEQSREVDPVAGLRAAVGLLPFWTSRGRIKEGRHHIHDLRKLAAEAGEEEVAAALRAEGTLALVMSDYSDAERLLTDALESYTQLGDRARAAAILNNLGVVAVDTGELEAAHDRYQKARTIFEETGDANGLAAAHLNLGVVELQMGRPDTARAQFLTALDGFRRVENRSEEAHALARLAYTAHFVGDNQEAAQWSNASRLIYSELGMTDGVARADWLLADIAREDGELATAGACASRAARAALSLRHERWWMPGLVEVASEVAAGIGDEVLAARLAGAAESFRRMSRTSKPAMSVPHYEAFLASLREKMGSDYGAATASGEALSIREALALVIESFETDPETAAPI